MPVYRPSLLYLPGLDGTGRLLYRQPRLHDLFGVRAVAYPHDCSTYDELVDLAIGQLEQTGPGIVLAESFGGAVALQLALRRPELVRRMVLVNTFAYFPRRVIIGILAALTPLLPSVTSHPATWPLRSFLFFSRDVPARDRREWWERTADVPMSAYGQRLRLIAGLDLRPRLPQIHTPTLVVTATDDRVVPPCAGKSLARALPNARFLKLRVGHAALIHPRVNIAELLCDPRYWPEGSASDVPASVTGTAVGIS